MVEGFTTTLDVVKLFEPSISSKLLWKLVTLASDGGEEHVILHTVVYKFYCIVSAIHVLSTSTQVVVCVAVFPCLSLKPSRNDEALEIFSLISSCPFQ